MTNKGSNKIAQELAEEWGVPVAKAQVVVWPEHKPVCICEECNTIIYTARNMTCGEPICPVVCDDEGAFVGVRNGYDIGSAKLTSADPADMDPCDCTNCGCKG